jgi:hypothetical protein
MAPTKRKFWEDLFAPLYSSCVLGYTYMFHLDTWTTHIPKFDGNPWLASRCLVSFMNNVVRNNIVHEDILMKMSAYSMPGKRA